MSEVAVMAAWYLFGAGALLGASLPLVANQQLLGATPHAGIGAACAGARIRSAVGTALEPSLASVSTRTIKFSTLGKET